MIVTPPAVAEHIVLNDVSWQRFERSENQLVRALVAWLRAQAARRGK